MPDSNHPSMNAAPTTRARPRGTARRRARRGVGLVAALAVLALAVPTAADAAKHRPYYLFKTVTLTSSATADAKVSPSLVTDLSGQKVGVFPDSTSWTNNGITNFYLTPDKATSFPTKNAETLLAKGVSLNLELSAKNTTYVAGIVSGNAAAMSWLNSYIADIKTISDYSKSLNNGTYVVAALVHEAQAQVHKGYLTGTSADPATIGKAQEIAIKLGKASAPNAYWSVWMVGYDHTFEGTELAQITNPKPDIITWDPYANHSCSDTIADIATDDLNWIKTQSAYNGRVALSESGMSNTCSDAQLATFYTGIAAKLRAFSPALSFFVYFDSNNGDYNHTMTTSKDPKGMAAMQASLTR